MTEANSRQVGGEHYASKQQHWDFVLTHGLGYLEGCATKYVCRWRRKDGVRDLEKALHYVDKLIETREARKTGQLRHAPKPEHYIHFAVANKLTAEDHLAFFLICDDQLEEARSHIEKMIEYARADGHAPRKCTTEQLNPRGFDPEQDVVQPYQAPGYVGKVDFASGFHVGARVSYRFVHGVVGLGVLVEKDKHEGCWRVHFFADGITRTIHQRDLTLAPG